MHNVLLIASGTAIDFSSIINILKGAITVEQLLTVIGSVMVVGVPFVVAWFGVRKLTRIFFGALTRGKLSV